MFMGRYFKYAPDWKNSIFDTLEYPIINQRYPFIIGPKWFEEGVGFENFKNIGFNDPQKFEKAFLLHFGSFAPKKDPKFRTPHSASLNCQTLSVVMPNCAKNIYFRPSSKRTDPPHIIFAIVISLLCFRAFFLNQWSERSDLYTNRFVSSRWRFCHIIRPFTPQYNLRHGFGWLWFWAQLLVISRSKFPCISIWLRFPERLMDPLLIFFWLPILYPMVEQNLLLLTNISPSRIVFNMHQPRWVVCGTYRMRQNTHRSQS